MRRKFKTRKKMHAEIRTLERLLTRVHSLNTGLLQELETHRPKVINDWCDYGYRFAIGVQLPAQYACGLGIGEKIEMKYKLLDALGSRINKEFGLKDGGK